LTLEDVRGATFTVSSTGGLERTTMVATTPVINLPNIATLWVSRITDRPRVVSGALEAGPVMACTLSFDHRYIDGAEGTAFINDLDDAFTSV
jgi:pyruvate/2-oxoglutarate dehydrogenase complex dihydrolipoamide acyltransferase (E2) component